MKRDFDLIRSILIQAEAVPAGTFPQTFNVPEGMTAQTLTEHIELMVSRGLIEGEVFSVVDGQFHVRKLTWEGHDFLDAARSDTVWKKAKEQLGKVGGSASLEIVKAVLVQITKTQLGLP